MEPETEQTLQTKALWQYVKDNRLLIRGFVEDSLDKREHFHPSLAAVAISIVSSFNFGRGRQWGVLLYAGREPISRIRDHDIDLWPNSRHTFFIYPVITAEPPDDLRRFFSARSEDDMALSLLLQNKQAVIARRIVGLPGSEDASDPHHPDENRRVVCGHTRVAEMGTAALVLMEHYACLHTLVLQDIRRHPDWKDRHKRESASLNFLRTLHDRFIAFREEQRAFWQQVMP